LKLIENTVTRCFITPFLIHVHAASHCEMHVWKFMMAVGQ